MHWFLCHLADGLSMCVYKCRSYLEKFVIRKSDIFRLILNMNEKYRSVPMKLPLYPGNKLFELI